MLTKKTVNGILCTMTDDGDILAVAVPFDNAWNAMSQLETGRYNEPDLNRISLNTLVSIA